MVEDHGGSELPQDGDVNSDDWQDDNGLKQDLADTAPPQDLVGPDVLDDVQDNSEEDPGAGDAVSDGGAEQDTEEIPAGLSISDTYVKVSPVCDQAIRVSFKTSVPAHASLLVETLEDATSFVKDGPAGFQVEHTIQVLGLKPSRVYKFTVKAEAEDGDVAEASPLSHKTASLPPDIPGMAVTAAKPALEGSGFTLLSMLRWSAFPDPDWGLLAAVDGEGVIRWRTNVSCTDFHLMPNGHLLCINGMSMIIEMDFFDGTIHQWNAGGLGLDSIHHAVYPLPDGNIVVLSTELRKIDYPVKGGGTETNNVVGDVVVEFQPDGTVVNTWKMLDLLDPYYIVDGFSFDEPFWNMVYPYASGGTKDWSHGNSLFYDPTDDTIVVSLAKLDYVVKVSRKTGELVWRFGAFGDFVLADGSWPSQQHAAFMPGDGELFLFDNGALKMPSASRAVEYFLDVTTGGDSIGKAWQVWEFTDDQPFFSQQFGDVALLPNGNVLVTDSSRMSNPQGLVWDPQNKKFSRVLEVTHASPSQIVHELVVPDPAVETEYGYWIFKAKHVELD